MRYAEALARTGAQVDAIVLQREGKPCQETIDGVRVLRIQKREKNERGKLSYLWRLIQFFFRSMAVLTREHLRHPYDLVHVHSVPDFEVFAALVPKLGGAKIVLDIHDIVPEFYAAKFGVTRNSVAFRALTCLERWSTGFADHVIAANDIWLEKIVNRSSHREKCSAFINYPDTAVFHAGLRNRAPDGKFIISYPGTLNWHQGLDIAVKAFLLAHQQAPGMELHIHGEGSAKPMLTTLVRELALQDKVFLHDPLPLREIATVMANADLGVVPKRNDEFGGEAFSTKILEFMAVGVPVVVARTRIDDYYFNESLLRFFEPNDEQDLAQKMLAAYQGREQSQELTASALEHVKLNNWGVRQHAYLGIVQGLVHGHA
ncbi:glycosyltransferase family 4 protein [Azohydromonas australica]|uniref:glycosyltransferase family 4 protein n=1 Tax=Azohydromonas australica TaxID=364039 RepID=UPI0004132596|nr:glycosyltransferase family 4 protein [Azohydromonas australica]